MGRDMVTKNFTGPGKYFFTVVNGASQVPPAYEGIVVVKQHKKGIHVSTAPIQNPTGNRDFFSFSVLTHFLSVLLKCNDVMNCVNKSN